MEGKEGVPSGSLASLSRDLDKSCPAPLEGAWDPKCEVLEACDPLSAVAGDFRGFTKYASILVKHRAEFPLYS